MRCRHHSIAQRFLPKRVEVLNAILLRLPEFAHDIVRGFSRLPGEQCQKIDPDFPP